MFKCDFSELPFEVIPYTAEWYEKDITLRNWYVSVPPILGKPLWDIAKGEPMSMSQCIIKQIISESTQIINLVGWHIEYVGYMDHQFNVRDVFNNKGE